MSGYDLSGPDLIAFVEESIKKLESQESAFVSYEDELRMGIHVLPPRLEKLMLDLYATFEPDWLEQEKSYPLDFWGPWEHYEWIFKRIIAGYRPSVEQLLFMGDFEETPEFWKEGKRPAFRYVVLSVVFRKELAHVFGDANRSVKQ